LARLEEAVLDDPWLEAVELSEYTTMRECLLRVLRVLRDINDLKRERDEAREEVSRYKRQWDEARSENVEDAK
jgi:hypothetical protein